MLNIPNTITLARIVLIPVFIGLLVSNAPYGQWMALAVFTVMAATDGLDGYVARASKQVTKTGKFLDPLADKLVITAALIGLVELRDLPALIAVIIIGREFIVSGLRLAISTKGEDMPASNLGKMKTFSQILAVFFWILKVEESLPFVDTIAWVSISVAVVLTIYSGIDYFINLKERLV